MILHILVGDAQIDSVIEGLHSAKLVVKDSNGREFGLSSTMITLLNVVKFDQTIHCPVSHHEEMSRLDFSFFCASRTNEKAISGSGSCVVSSLEHASTKRIVLFNGLGDKEASIVVTFFYFKKPIDITDKMLNSFDMSNRQGNPKEYSFLLNRKMQALARGKNVPTSFNDTTEKLITADIVLNHPHARKASIESYSDHRSESRTKSVSAMKSSTNTRKTSMSVGYVGVSWPDPKLAEREKILYKIHLADQRRLDMLKQVEASLHRKNAQWKAKSEQIKHHSIERDDSENRYADILRKKEMEIQHLRNQLKENEIRKICRSASPTQRLRNSHGIESTPIEKQLSTTNSSCSTSKKPKKPTRMAEKRQLSSSSMHHMSKSKDWKDSDHLSSMKASPSRNLLISSESDRSVSHGVSRTPKRGSKSPAMLVAGNEIDSKRSASDSTKTSLKSTKEPSNASAVKPKKKKSLEAQPSSEKQKMSLVNQAAMVNPSPKLQGSISRSEQIEIRKRSALDHHPMNRKIDLKMEEKKDSWSSLGSTTKPLSQQFDDDSSTHDENILSERFWNTNESFQSDDHHNKEDPDRDGWLQSARFTIHEALKLSERVLNGSYGDHGLSSRPTTSLSRNKVDVMNDSELSDDDDDDEGIYYQPQRQEISVASSFSSTDQWNITHNHNHNHSWDHDFAKETTHVASQPRKNELSSLTKNKSDRDVNVRTNHSSSNIDPSAAEAEADPDAGYFQDSFMNLRNYRSQKDHPSEDDIENAALWSSFYGQSKDHSRYSENDGSLFDDESCQDSHSHCSRSETDVANENISSVDNDNDYDNDEDDDNDNDNDNDNEVESDTVEEASIESLELLKSQSSPSSPISYVSVDYPSSVHEEDEGNRLGQINEGITHAIAKDKDKDKDKDSTSSSLGATMDVDAVNRHGFSPYLARSPSDFPRQSPLSKRYIRPIESSNNIDSTRKMLVPSEENIDKRHLPSIMEETNPSMPMSANSNSLDEINSSVSPKKNIIRKQQQEEEEDDDDDDDDEEEEEEEEEEEDDDDDEVADMNDCNTNDNNDDDNDDDDYQEELLLAQRSEELTQRLLNLRNLGVNRIKSVNEELEKDDFFNVQDELDAENYGEKGFGSTRFDKEVVNDLKDSIEFGQNSWDRELNSSHDSSYFSPMRSLDQFPSQSGLKNQSIQYQFEISDDDESSQGGGSDDSDFSDDSGIVNNLDGENGNKNNLIQSRSMKHSILLDDNLTPTRLFSRVMNHAERVLQDDDDSDIE